MVLSESRCVDDKVLEMRETKTRIACQQELKIREVQANFEVEERLGGLLPSITSIHCPVVPTAAGYTVKGTRVLCSRVGLKHSRHAESDYRYTSLDGTARVCLVEYSA